MKTLKLAAPTIFFVVMMTAQAFALGEVFKVETSGTEYCGDYYFSKFNANNNVDLWIRIVSETEITISFTPDFADEASFPMYGATYFSGKNKAAFVGGVLFEDYSYATIQGKAAFDKFGSVRSLQGTFIQNGVLGPDCFSSGKFKTVQRLQ